MTFVLAFMHIAAAAFLLSKVNLEVVKQVCFNRQVPYLSN